MRGCVARSARRASSPYAGVSLHPTPGSGVSGPLSNGARRQRTKGSHIAFIDRVTDPAPVDANASWVLTRSKPFPANNVLQRSYPNPLRVLVDFWPHAPSRAVVSARPPVLSADAAPSDVPLPPPPDGRLCRDARILPILSICRRNLLAVSVTPVRVASDGIPSPTQDLRELVAPHAPILSFPCLVGHHTVAYGISGCIQHLNTHLPHENLLPKQEMVMTTAVSLLSASERLYEQIFAQTAELAYRGMDRARDGRLRRPTQDAEVHEYLTWEDVVNVVRDGAPPLRVSRRVRAALTEVEALIAHCRERFGGAAFARERATDIFQDLNSYLDPQGEIAEQARQLAGVRKGVRVDAGGVLKYAGTWLLGGPVPSAVDHVFVPLAWVLAATNHPFKYAAAARWVQRAVRHRDIVALNEVYYPPIPTFQEQEASSAVPPPRRGSVPYNAQGMASSQTFRDGDREANDGGEGGADSVAAQDDQGEGSDVAPDNEVVGRVREFLTIERLSGSLCTRLPAGETGEVEADGREEEASRSGSGFSSETAEWWVSGKGSDGSAGESGFSQGWPFGHGATAKLGVWYRSRQASRFATELTARLYHARAGSFRDASNGALLRHILSTDTPRGSLSQVREVEGASDGVAVSPGSDLIGGGGAGGARVLQSQRARVSGIPRDAFGRPADAFDLLAAVGDFKTSRMQPPAAPRRFVVRPWVMHGQWVSTATRAPTPARASRMDRSVASDGIYGDDASSRVEGVYKRDGLCLLMHPDVVAAERRRGVSGDIYSSNPIRGGGSQWEVGEGAGGGTTFEDSADSSVQDARSDGAESRAGSPVLAAGGRRSARSVVQPLPIASYGGSSTAGSHARMTATRRPVVVRADRSLPAGTDGDAAVGLGNESVGSLPLPSRKEMSRKGVGGAAALGAGEGSVASVSDREGEDVYTLSAVSDPVGAPGSVPSVLSASAPYIHTRHLADKRRKFGDIAVDPSRDVELPDVRGAPFGGDQESRREPGQPTTPRTHGGEPIQQTPRPPRQMGKRKKVSMQDQ